MNCFSSQRHNGAFLSRFGVLSLFLVSFLLGLPAHAQSADELFRGTWQITTPEDGSLILIVKRQGRAAYFWGDNADRTVYQGTWTSDENAATLRWADGSTHRIERGSPGYTISHVSAAGVTRYSVPAQQVPREILGQWAKPPTKPEDALSDRDRAKGFFGIWQIKENGETHYVFVESDRSAASTWNGGQIGTNGLRGSWARQGSELHIIWDSGHYSVLRENPRGFTYKRIEPGAVIEDDTTEYVPASRTNEDNVPQAWLAVYKQEQETYSGGIAFSSRKNARQFYRGFWIVRRGQETYERIEITRFGSLKTSRDSSLTGDWLMSGQDIFMRWDNGMRKILGPVGRGFVLYEYRPGRPLDGVPTRVLPAAPSDSTKLADHLKGRADVSRQMLELAEAAGVDPNAESAGWGRSFARWAWPFGSDEAASPDLLLDEAYDNTPGAQDPWWWPFWSERSRPSEEPAENPEESTATPETAQAEPEAPAAESTSPAPADASSSPSSTEPTSKRTTRPTKKDWYWPF